MEITGTASFSKCKVVAMEDRKSLVCTEKENIGNCPTVKHSCLCAGRGVLACAECFPKVSFLSADLYAFALFLRMLFACLKSDGQRKWEQLAGTSFKCPDYCEKQKGFLLGSKILNKFTVSASSFKSTAPLLPLSSTVCRGRSLPFLPLDLQKQEAFLLLMPGWGELPYPCRMGKK